jgi:hypothetical protein
LHSRERDAELIQKLEELPVDALLISFLAHGVSAGYPREVLKTPPIGETRTGVGGADRWVDLLTR